MQTDVCQIQRENRTGGNIAVQFERFGMNDIRVLRCSSMHCERTTKDPQRGTLILSNAKYSGRLIKKGTLTCQTCGAKYFIEDGIPNMLPEKIRRHLEGKSRKDQLSKYDRFIIDGIQWSGKMVPSYHENVVDPFSSAFGPRYIERYEDLYIDNVMDEHIKVSKEKTIFVEMGVGTGRYLIRYGARTANGETEERRKYSSIPLRRYLKPKACKAYRQDPTLKRYYSYDKDYDRNLQLVVGVDFQKGMISKCIKVLKEMKLSPLIGRRILLIVGAAQYFNLAFDGAEEYKNSFKVVTCAFQTLGNQPKDLRIGLLKTLKKLASPRGKIIVSVFNRERFIDFGLNRFYKSEVAPTVGKIREDGQAIRLRDEGILTTDRGVYSKWFYEEELERLFTAAGLDATVRNYKHLGSFPENADYLSIEDQEDIRKILIIAEAKL